jgi:hypothetical protein
MGHKSTQMIVLNGVNVETASLWIHHVAGTAYNTAVESRLIPLA